MNVPPLWTVAVRARAQAPSVRFPRKYASRDRPRAATRAASGPRQTDATTTPRRASRAPQPAVGPVAEGTSDSGITPVLAPLADLFVANEPPREPACDQDTHAPGRHDAPEHPRGESQHEGDRLPRAAVAEVG